LTYMVEVEVEVRILWEYVRVLGEYVRVLRE
jgi:hypothetical protein